MNVRRFFSVILILLLSISLVACNSESGSSTENADNNKNGSDKVEIRFAWWGSAERDKIYNQILDLYEEQNPNVKIIREPTGWNDYWTKLSTQAAGKNLPDVFGLHLLLYGNEYFTKDVLEPLDTYVESGVISTEGWDQSVLDAGTYNNQLLALAKGVTIQSFITNISKIEKLGMELPPANMTYEDLKEYALEMKEKLPEGEYVFSGDPTSIEHGIEMWARQRGGSFLKEDGSELGFSKEDLTDYWTYWDDFRKAGVIPSGEVSAEQSGVTDENTLFATGKAIFIERPTNQAKVFANYAGGDKLGILRYPLMEDGQYKSGEQLQVPAIVMSKNAKNKEEAAKLINWFVNDLEATKIYKAENGLPGTAPVRDNLTDVLDPLDVEAIEIMEKVGEEIPPTTIRPNGSVEILTIYKRYAEMVAFEKLSIKDAVDQFFDETNKALNK
ncbi:ABC transporter substrate-binding protein [Metabacillus halosaccharovorans]|uniref:ABC transporter substrate-binding protein n=1 Tax=Metabacillus halosaccharovorans TaxID=930124 RepID=UPI00203EC142|nr:extracellular solute-binding protein [Metabacillus halosaccharovorans]MCM3439370.1 extracellular solute-binding protein [Metabacillus halosaccharovorans]